MCLKPLEYLPFLEKKTAEVLSQYIFSGLEIELTTPRPEIHLTLKRTSGSLNELTNMCEQKEVRQRQGHHQELAVIQGATKKRTKYEKGKKVPPKKGNGPGESSQGHKVGSTVKC